MINKCLVVASTFNAPVFLKLFLESFEKFDPGYPCDLLIWDCENTDPESIALLDLAGKKHMILKRPNVGRAQAGYNAAFHQFPDYEYYFFLHDDSCFMRDNWLLKGIDRMHDYSIEDCLDPNLHLMDVGKIGYCSYEYGNIDKYFRTGEPAIFKFIRPILESQPLYKFMLKYNFQHVADDRVLYSNRCLRHVSQIHHIEAYRNPDGSTIASWIGDYFAANYPGRGFIEPKERYNNADWEGYQSWCEFLNDISPFAAGFRSHNLYGDGYCQEELGFSVPWACSDVVHFGAHNTFKYLAQSFYVDEQEIRKGYNEINELRFFADWIKLNNNGSDHRYAQQSSAD